MARFRRRRVAKRSEITTSESHFSRNSADILHGSSGVAVTGHLKALSIACTREVKMLRRISTLRQHAPPAALRVLCPGLQLHPSDRVIPGGLNRLGFVGKIEGAPFSVCLRVHVFVTGLPSGLQCLVSHSWISFVASQLHFAGQ